MKRTVFALVLGIGLMILSCSRSEEQSLSFLVSRFLAGIVKTDRIYKNEFGDSYKIMDTKKLSDLETLVVVEFPSAGKSCSEEIIFRILEAELFLTEDFSSLGISGVARIEWAYGLRNSPQGLPGIEGGQEQYFVLSKKENHWVSPADAWVPDTFREVKSHWAIDKKGKHEKLNSPSASGQSSR